MTTTTTTPKKRVRNPRPLPPPLRDDVQRVERKVDALSAALAQLASAQATTLEAMTTLVNAMAMLLQCQARPPVVVNGGTLRPDGPRDWRAAVDEEEAAAIPHEGVVPRRQAPRPEIAAEDDRLVPRSVPRGTAQAVTDPVTNAPEPPLRVPSDFADMAHELADLAEEDEAPPPPPDEYEVWERRVAIYHGQRLWRETWGPRPGQDGCLCPPELLRGRR